MNSSILVRLIGFPATLIHGDTLVLDRWRWLRQYLPKTAKQETLLDVGCGSGAFTIGAGKRGYQALGLSWDERNQKVAQERAEICQVPQVLFEIQDIRKLDVRVDLLSRFDYVICLETIEHILDDRKLIRDISNCLKKGGKLLLTTPYLHYRPMSKGDMGPFLLIENGDHVRKGYIAEELQELCLEAGLEIHAISSCSGFLSQKITALVRLIGRYHQILGWLVILPLRVFPILFDPIIRKTTHWPDYCICIKAVKIHVST